MALTQVLVRVQAKGGKFLGADAGYSRVTLRDAASGRVLAEGMAGAASGPGSGALTGGFSAGATRQAVVTQQFGTQTTLWLAAAAGEPTAEFRAALELGAPTLVEFSAEALDANGGGTPIGIVARQTMWVVPGQDLTADPGVVLVVPGLRVTVEAPSGTVTDSGVGVQAKVTMMCGCPIGPGYPWPDTEFAVEATVARVDGGYAASAPLAWQATSTFATTSPIPLAGPGEYRVTVTAVQAAEANAGSASAAFIVTA